LFATEMYSPKKLSIINALKKTWDNSKKGVRFSLSHRTVFLLILGSLFIGLLLFGENGWQPFMVNLSMPQYALGFVYSVVAIGWVLGPFVPKLFKKVNIIKTAVIVIIVRMLLLFSVVFIYPPLFVIAAAILVFDQGFKSMSDPLLLNYIHKFIPTKIRATVISIKSMGVQIVAALSGLIAGVLQDILGPQIVLALGGLFGVFAIATFLKIKD
jgi:predicted MFS family arabinose efflux permease